MKSYNEINKKINNYLQALTSNKSVFDSVERRRIRIATNNLTPKNKTLLEEEYEKLREEASTFKSLMDDDYERYDINQQLMDVIKYIRNTLYNNIKKLGVDGTRLDIQRLTMQAEKQIEQLRNDIAIFTSSMQKFNDIKETPVGSANSIIPESNPAFINYVSQKQNKDILLVPLPDNSGFNLVILDNKGEINKESGVIPLSEFSKSMQAGQLSGYFDQVPNTETLNLFYQDLDSFVQSLIQTDMQLFQQTGMGLFTKKPKEEKKEDSRAPRMNEQQQAMPEASEKDFKNFLTKNPQGKQMLYSFLEDGDLIGYYKNLQYSEYIDKNKLFTTENYLKAIENYLVSKFNMPRPQPEEENQQQISENAIA